MTTNIQKIETLQDQPVILEQPAFWTRAFIWLIVVMTASTIIWAALAKIDHSIPAPGKLEPDGALKEVKAPIGGVVRDIHVKGGDRVNEGDLLITLDPTTSEAEVASLREVQEALEQQNVATTSTGGTIGDSSSNRNSLIQMRTALASENEFLQAQVDGGSPAGLAGGSFDANQRQLLEVSRTELESRKRAANAEIRTLEEQISQTSIQKQGATERRPLEQIGLDNAQERLVSARQRLRSAQERQSNARGRLLTTQERERKAKEQLENENKILERIRPVVEQGAVAELQLSRQEQEVLSAEDSVLALQREISAAQDEISRFGDEIDETREEMNALEGDIASRRAQISDIDNEILRLQEEEQRLQAAIEQAEARSKNSVDTTKLDILQRIAANKRQIAQLDDQLTREALDNQRQLAQVSAQLTQAEKTLEYRELRSPVNGIIFEVKPNAIGDVIGQGSSGTEPVVTIVPEAKLKASVEVTNKDIGFVEEGMEVEVQIDAFPATEFGTIPGTLTSIGNDVLPPDQTHQYYYFPVTVELGQEYIDIGGKQIYLQSGMAVRANLKVRERSVLSIFLSRFESKVEVLKEVR